MKSENQRRSPGAGLIAAGLLAAAISWAAACAGTEPRDLSSAARQAGAAPSLQRACELADRRCSRCHPIERVLIAGVHEPADWENYVHRMRLTPGSGITAREEPAIVRCLVQHSFGEQARR
jgi:cytochrome c5